jgi:hypothetical protein
MRTILIAVLMLGVACYRVPRYADDGAGTVVRRVELLPPPACAPGTSAVVVETCSFRGCVTNVYELRGVVVSR